MVYIYSIIYGDLHNIFKEEIPSIEIFIPHENVAKLEDNTIIAIKEENGETAGGNPLSLSLCTLFQYGATPSWCGIPIYLRCTGW